MRKIEGYKHVCGNCKIIFTNKCKRSKYCSWKCFNEFVGVEHKEQKCQQCNKIIGFHYGDRKFCSNKCSQDSMRGNPFVGKRPDKVTYKEKICEYCNEKYIPESGKQKYCGKCKFYCKICSKEISNARNTMLCSSCWQLGERNNSKKESFKKQLSDSWKRGERINPMLGKKHKPSTLKFFSETRSGKNNPNFGKVTYGTGRCKWFDYYSNIAGDVRLQGTYELRMAKILDKLGWQWNKTSDHFKYDNGNHCYIPDFKITKRENDDCLFYIDTKGWFPIQDQIKIAKVREENLITLLIMDKNMLNEYERRVA